MSYGKESSLQAADIARQQARQKRHGHQGRQHPNDKRQPSEAVNRHLELMRKLHA
ncbi:hypothetical protein HNO51_12460 [Billgrantia sulfidoxydans]|uniref:Small EDRK-rich factor-like N-terminal domain-containing protein n=1 Tax=Billgrantia sulfidoxydans TaxID=2733484 RepID=A0ABX7W6B0_9GAMM|nr:hypothetical protein [Halomonas sulfidoxydans]QTP55421.1 hypothetical protein HNO51_12460 [Halomonas sulfidoxydans]